MTLVAAWVRHNNNTKELYVSSDSRLSGGRAWDIGPKVLDLGRGDSVIAFAGDTNNAYPLMLQLQSAVQMHPKMRSRAFDLTILRGYLLSLFNEMWKQITDLPRGQKLPDPAEVKFILAGYSWKTQSFKIWTVYFDNRENAFKFRSASTHRKKGGGNKYFAFIGDDANLANERVYALLRERNRIEDIGIHMEPFEVLKEFIFDRQKPYIGGAPQIFKVYNHLNTKAFNVYWPNKESKEITFGGRVLIHFERNELLAFDPDTFETEKTNWPTTTINIIE
ncbi:hypothetical protein HUZ62_25905 (plasmid) [Klebsiella pneumoniae]|uniref:hypothetical protein n=1 Tax=Klebsiella pneumoniae TaxID=573 RepID=UPI001EF7632A|nr:hypothetical protein [Klebsiella pneumoniae]ULI82318.1 hypothetical protein HUZ62_25905 [Klebsiella pneumoniae]